MKKLTLQITRDNFEYILTGEQKTEHRDVWPSNVKKYVDVDYEKGDVTPVQYDALYLINGRKKDAPRLLVEVESAEWVVFTDENGNDLTFQEKGETYLQSQVWYHLGKVLETENVGDDFVYKYAGKVPYDYGCDDRPRAEREADAAKAQAENNE